MDEGNAFVKRLLESQSAGRLDWFALEVALVCLKASQGIFYEDNIPILEGGI